MYEKLRGKVDRLFESAPNTKRAYELKEEFTANLIDRYEDLLADGKGEDEAINIAIAGVGDIDGILGELKEKNNNFDYEKIKKDREKSALCIATSIALYMISFAVLVFCEDFLHLNDGISCGLMFLIDAGATFILIYNSILRSRVKYEKLDDSMVEEFKEWRTNRGNEKEIKKSIKTIVWCLTVVIYFIVSFAFENWEMSWVIFLIGAIIDRIVLLIIELRK